MDGGLHLNDLHLTQTAAQRAGETAKDIAGSAASAAVSHSAFEYGPGAIKAVKDAAGKKFFAQATESAAKAVADDAAAAVVTSGAGLAAKSGVLSTLGNAAGKAGSGAMKVLKFLPVLTIAKSGYDCYTDLGKISEYAKNAGMESALGTPGIILFNSEVRSEFVKTAAKHTLEAGFAAGILALDIATGGAATVIGVPAQIGISLAISGLFSMKDAALPNAVYLCNELQDNIKAGEKMPLSRVSLALQTLLEDKDPKLAKELAALEKENKDAHALAIQAIADNIAESGNVSGTLNFLAKSGAMTDVMANAKLIAARNQAADVASGGVKAQNKAAQAEEQQKLQQQQAQQSSTQKLAMKLGLAAGAVVATAVVATKTDVGRKAAAKVGEAFTSVKNSRTAKDLAEKLKPATEKVSTVVAEKTAAVKASDLYGKAQAAAGTAVAGAKTQAAMVKNTIQENITEAQKRAHEFLRHAKEEGKLRESAAFHAAKTGAPVPAAATSKAASSAVTPSVANADMEKAIAGFKNLGVKPADVETGYNAAVTSADKLAEKMAAKSTKTH